MVDRDGEPWFVARDVATVLGYSDVSQAVRMHCKGVVESTIPTAGGNQKAKIIPERDVYRLIMRSKLPAAERFEEWVVGEVLPTIRKRGVYGRRHGVAVPAFCHRASSEGSGGGPQPADGPRPAGCEG